MKYVWYAIHCLEIRFGLLDLLNNELFFDDVIPGQDDLTEDSENKISYEKFPILIKTSKRAWAYCIEAKFEF